MKFDFECAEFRFLLACSYDSPTPRALICLASTSPKIATMKNMVELYKIRVVFGLLHSIQHSQKPEIPSHQKAQHLALNKVNITIWQTKANHIVRGHRKRNQRISKLTQTPFHPRSSLINHLRTLLAKQTSNPQPDAILHPPSLCRTLIAFIRW